MVQDGYGTYAAFYDAIQGDRTERIVKIQTLIDTYAPRAESILELACGTGTILEGLHAHYRKTGLDDSKAMLALATQRLPHATLIEGDMADFSLPDTFDVIFCTFNSINHLLSFKAWQSMFDSVYKQLRPKGLFIFDVNTTERMQALAALGSWTKDMGNYEDNYLLVYMTTPEKDVFTWHLQIFERIKTAKTTRMHSQQIPTRTFPLSKIEAELARHFAILSARTGSGNPILNEDAGRTYYVCQAK